jgi:hypothetical protein
MKKNDRRIKPLHLNCETLVRLAGEELTKAQGGMTMQDNQLKCTGCDSGCGIFE